MTVRLATYNLLHGMTVLGGVPEPVRDGNGRPVGPPRVDDEEPLRRAVADLPARQKEAVVLLRLQEMSGKEASAASGRPEGTLKVSLHRAVESLRRMLGGD